MRGRLLTPARALQKIGGVTLIELLVAISVVAILSAIAAPNFAAVLRTNARTAAVNEFIHSLLLARSTAVTSGSSVAICPSRNGLECSNGSGWEAGWIVFENPDREQPPLRDGNELVLYRNHGWQNGNIRSNRPAFAFRHSTQGDVNGTVVFCTRGSANEARAIIISHSGRPRVSKRDASNRALQCP
jgi:type IV fimbrial biogenesis protein FimT